MTWINENTSIIGMMTLFFICFGNILRKYFYVINFDKKKINKLTKKNNFLLFFSLIFLPKNNMYDYINYLYINQSK